jgi:hypothetical protein
MMNKEGMRLPSTRKEIEGTLRAMNRLWIL